MKRCSPDRQFKSFLSCTLNGKYDSLMNFALEKLTLFGNNNYELVLDNQFERKYLPVIIHRKFEDKHIDQPGVVKGFYSSYPNYDSFGFGVINDRVKALYCNPNIKNEIYMRRDKYSKSIEFMQHAKEDFSNILGPLQMIPISERDVLTWFRGHKNVYDVILINYMDNESLIDIHGQLASYCQYASKQHDIPFEQFPIQISYFNDYQKSMIEKSIVESLKKIDKCGDNEEPLSIDKDLLKLWLNRPNIVSREKIGDIYFPKMRNNLVTLSDFMLYIF